MKFCPNICLFTSSYLNDVNLCDLLLSSENDLDWPIVQRGSDLRIVALTPMLIGHKNYCIPTVVSST